MRIYSNDEISVIWRPEKCIHARECVKGLPAVFNKDRSPWVNMQGASSEEIIEVVGRCPSGALTCKRRSEDGLEGEYMGASEVHGTAHIKTTKNGPLLVEGDVALLDSGGKVLAGEGTYALCRCGGSKKKPFCDGTHLQIGFDDSK